MNELKDKDLREALSRREGKWTKPEVPADFCSGIMQQIEPKKKSVVLWRWMTLAASLLILIGIATLQFTNKQEHPKPLVAKVEIQTAVMDSSTSKATDPSDKPVEQPIVESPANKATEPSRRSIPQTVVADSKSAIDKIGNLQSPIISDIHYAAYTLEQDSNYQDPARVDEFIEKFATVYDVRQGELACSLPIDSSLVNTVYVFPDNKETDVFGRLLQVACWYSNETPGYHLNFTNQQFFFQLRDKYRHLQYNWIAERINGKILVFGCHAPIGADNTFACYQEYRNELMNIKRNNTKTLEI